MPTNMKGLQVFIAAIRNCPNKEMEQKRVDKELAKIRNKFTNDKNLKGYDKKKYVWKLLYAYMLGYDIDFGHIQAVNLCSSTKFSEKNAGYLACTLLLVENHEILRLIVNIVKNDMVSGNEHIVALALNTVANIGGIEFSENLFQDISKLLGISAPYSSYVKRKAAICLLRLYRRDNDTIVPGEWNKRLSALLQEKDVGLLLSVCGFVIGILEQGVFPVTEWVELMPSVTNCLNNIVQSECPPHHIYYTVPAPWLQTKLLRILQFFPTGSFDEYTLHRVNSMLNAILTKPTVQQTVPPPGTQKKRSKADNEKMNRSNAEHAILFEAMNLVIHLEDKCDRETTRTASNLLGAFISSNDANIRYLGLETMARLASNGDTLEHLDRYKNLILGQMHDTDVSLRRQALNLLYAICRPENWQGIVDELLEILSSSDQLLQEELVLKIAILAEQNAPDFTWYVDVIFRMLEHAPDSVGDDVWYRVVQVVTGFDGRNDDDEKAALQRHAAQKAFDVVSGHFPHETMVKLGTYLIGEFGHLLPERISPLQKFDVLRKHYERVGRSCKGILLLASIKLLNANPDRLRDPVLSFLEDLTDQLDVELQQRVCEMLALSQEDDLMETVLAMMPVFAESIQANNPLIRRLKFQNKSRAHTRSQLEEAAKSEGGVLKPGAGNLSGRKDGATPRSESGRSPRVLLGNELGGPSPQDTNGRSGGNYSDGGSRSGSGSSSGSDDEGDGRGGPATNSRPGQGPKELWTTLCIQTEGPFYQSNSLCLALKQEYQGFQGRIAVNFVNNSNAPIDALRVMCPEVPFLRMNASSAPSKLRPGEQQQHYLQVQCMQPFLQPPRYLVEFYAAGDSKPTQLPLMLPCTLTKFIVPAELQPQYFISYFQELNGPGQESQLTSAAKVGPDKWPMYLSKGFNLFVLEGSNANTTCAAGTFQTGTPNPAEPGKMMTVHCMVRLEHDHNRHQTRITVRTQHAQVSQALIHILATYLLQPPERGDGA